MPILPRGAGSSQCGQAVGAALVIDHTKYLNKVLEVDAAAMRAVVQPGVVLDALNAQLRAHGLWFPVDVSTSAQATLGGMAGNNSCGSRSIAYGNMVHNVLAIDAVTVDGRALALRADGRIPPGPTDYVRFAARLKGLYEREKAEIEARFPKVLRKVAGYNLDHLGPPHANAAHLLVGSEGTLAYSERIHLKLCARPAAARARRVPLPEVLHRDGADAAHRQARAFGGRAGRPHHDRPGARHRRVPQDGGRVHQGRAGRDPAGRIFRRRESGAQAEGAGAADGATSACPAAWSRSPTRSSRKSCGRCARPASTS